MVATPSFEQIVQMLVREASEDIVGIWVVAGIVSDAFRSMGADAVQAMTLKVIEHALEQELVVIGSFEEKELKTWTMNVANAIKTIRSRWEAKGSPPSMDDNIWLSAPHLGYHVLSFPLN